MAARLPTFALATSLLTPFASAQSLDWTATAPETVLSTDSTIMQPTSGPPITVVGGVFVFNQVTIPAGTVVRARGSRPMVWIVNSMTIDGELRADGQDGQIVLTIGTAIVPQAGGLGGPAGGRGGRGTPNATARSFTGEPGDGSGGLPGQGGGGGIMSLLASCQRGSGGGGGAFATLGDPWFKSQAGTGIGFAQRAGFGGYGCLGASGTATRTLPGGAPNLPLCNDGRTDNDFLGIGFDYASQTLVAGELPLLVGGAGGGGGGDRASDQLLQSPNWPSDAIGGGGGGGGGCLLIAAQGNIVVGPTGLISANGGNGGGGEQAGSSNEGGGGGGGSGGLLILASRGQIHLHVKGETYANNDFDFVLSADGGISRTTAFGSTLVLRKYPANGAPTVAGTAYDATPLGGFGGMGIVQMVTFAGSNADGTNTRFDDNILLFRNGLPLSGAQKQRYLAWRGYRNAQGVLVDDAGVPTNIQGNEGDIRPAPVLLPIL